jgi:hypothetical protein
VPKHRAARSASSNAGTPPCRHGLWPWRNAPSCDRPVPAYDGECRPTWHWPRNHGLCPWSSIILEIFVQEYFGVNKVSYVFKEKK